MRKILAFSVCAAVLLGLLSACTRGTGSSEAPAQSSLETTTTAAVTTTEAVLVTQELLIFKFVAREGYDELVTEALSVPNADSLLEKLQAVADRVSQDCFDGLEIEVVKIEDGIAYIDLRDDPEESARTGWIQRFQGSAGASDTAALLFENFFQRQLSSNWITAVQLLHNGELMEEMDHFSYVGVVEIDEDFRDFFNVRDTLKTGEK